MTIFAVSSQKWGQAEIPKEKFEVVDRYKNCDVIRYSPWKVSEYKYFLHCEP